MADAKESLDYWRKKFSCAKSDIFELIEKAILIATVDFPNEFKDRRILIAEKLFASHLSLCSDCYRAELQALNNGNETRIVGELMRIKELLCNYQDESDTVLYESLRSLQLMQLSVEILMETEIGRSVNALRKHNSNLIRKLVRTLINDWKLLVDQWLESMNSAESVDCCSSILTVEQEPSTSDEDSDTLKLENAKKKLREGYERAESAKKQRMIQVIELGDMPVDSHNEKGRPKKKLGKHCGLRLGR